VIFCGPVGVGKSWFAKALDYSACRAGHRVRFTFTLFFAAS
jgi:DNA replication protein DnaC